MRKRQEVASAVIVAVGVLALVAPASAGAAVQIGTTFPGATGACGTDFTNLQSTSPSGSYAAPSAGVITSWTFQAGGTAPSGLKLKVARPVAGDFFTIVGESPSKDPTPNTIHTYTDVRISVQPGDVIGFHASGGGTAPCFKTSSDYTFHTREGDQAPGTTASYSPLANSQMNLATLLEPDSDNDGFGDETQDQCPGVAGPLNGCPVSQPQANPSNNSFGFGKLKRNKKKGIAFLFVNVLGPGEVGLAGKGVKNVGIASASARKSVFTAGGVVKLRIKPGKGKKARKVVRQLKNKGKAKVKVRVTYVPTGGLANTQARKVKLVRK